MPLCKRKNFSHDELASIYKKSGSIEAAANVLDVSYPTAQKWLKELGISGKAGYRKPELAITGLQCRHIREFLGFTRDDIANRVNVSKTTLQVFELNKKTMRESKMAVLLKFFESEGIIINEDGTWHKS